MLYHSQPPEDPRDGISDAIGLLVGIAIAMWIASMLSSCSPKTIVVPERHTEYITRTDTLVRHDSIYHHDSVSVYLQGDTICRDRYRYIHKYRNIYRTRTDTMIKVDSVRAPMLIEKPLTRWQEWKMSLGGWCMTALGCLLVGTIAYYIMKKRG